MSEDEELVLLFVPALAVTLAAAEANKGQQLTEIEVIAVRDQSPCIALPVAEANAMAESRGFVDVNPDNCWVDWHRLRVQMSGQGYLPKLVLCLPGGPTFRANVESVLLEETIEHEFVERDSAMIDAFQSCRSGASPSLREEDYSQIASHAEVLYMLSPNFTARESAIVCLKFLRIACWLLENGAVAMKCESSGIAHSRERWLTLSQDAERGDLSTPELWNALFCALVQFPISDGEELYSCGMHLLGKPDVIISAALLPPNLQDRTPAGAASYLFHSFCWYLLAECKDGKFGSGHTFQPDAKWPRYRLTWEECRGYAEDDLYFNPFGRWRFAAIA